MAVPVRRAASHGMVMPVEGITRMSPGTKLSLGTSDNSVRKRGGYEEGGEGMGGGKRGYERRED